MNEAHREHLRKCRELLVKNIGDIETVVYSIGSKGVITAYMEEEILAQKTHVGKGRELLKILPRRGEDAFNMFYDVLLEVKEFSAADIVKPELKHHRTRRRNDSPSHVSHPLPSKFPVDNEELDVINVRKCSTRNQYFHNILTNPNDREVYSMTKLARGLCLIINNEKFDPEDLEDREGSEKDEKSLYSLFHQLHFKVKVENDKTASEMRDLFDEYKRIDHTDMDCFVLVILSHGSQGSVYGVDGKTVEIEEIINKFDSVGSKSLAGKPKIFFIQACQGKKKDFGTAGHNPVQEEDQQEISIISNTLKQLHLDSQKERADVSSNTASRADMFIAMATSPGYVSWRRIDIGTWFIQAVVYAFKWYAHESNLNSLMTKVNALVQSAETQDLRNKQAPESRSSLGKDLYFFPGLFVDSIHGRPNQVQPTDTHG